MKLTERNGKIYVDLTIDGRRFRRGLGLAYTRANLNHALTNIIPTLVNELSRQTKAKRDYKLSELLEFQIKRTKHLKLNTQITYKSAKALILAHLKDADVTSYKPQHIDSFFARLCELGYSEATQRLVKGLLKMAFDRAIRLELIDFNPVFKVEINSLKQKIKRVVYSKEQVALLLEKSKKELKTFLHFAFFTGARANEILALKTSDIKGDYIIISKTLLRNGKKFTNSPKNGKARVVFIAPALAEYIKGLKLESESEIFTLCYSLIRAEFKKLCGELGLAYAGLHSLRHTYASLLLNDKVEPYTIAQALGHSDLKMLEKIYGHFLGYSDSDKSAIAKSLDFSMAQIRHNER